MSMRWGVLILGFLAGAPAFGARIVGNGGVGVSCADEAGREQSVEVLDLYEARHTDWQMPPGLGGDTVGYMEKVRLVLRRLAPLDPRRAARYGAWLDAFDGESFIFNDDHHFELINDYGSPLLQRRCHTVQIAVQRQPDVPEDRRYLIDGSLWKKLSEDDKAGLVLHELIFRDALERGQENSVATHYFTALFAWGEFTARIDAAELAKRYRRYDMDAYTAIVSVDGSYYKLLYFDDGAKAYLEAERACRALGMDASVLSDRAITQPQQQFYLKVKPLGVKLLQPDGGTDLWLAGGRVLYRFSAFDPGILPQTGTDPTAAAYICQVRQH